MPKVKLTEKDLRNIIERLLVEEGPPPPPDDADAAPAEGEEVNARAVKITDINTPGLEAQLQDLETFHAQVTGAGDLYPSGYPSIDEMIAQPDGVLTKYASETKILYDASFDSNDIEGSRIAYVKALLKYEIMLALQGKLPGQDAQRVAYFMPDVAYIRAAEDNWSGNFVGGTPNTYEKLLRTKNAIYGGNSDVKDVTFGSKQFYDKLGDANFVKTMISQDVWYKPETYGAGVEVAEELAQKTIANAQEQLKFSASKMYKLYEQFDSDYVEEFFCMPLKYPNYWKIVTSPDDHPLYTPWRQTYVMLNILAQAMSIPGGLESLYLKFADYMINGPRRQTMGAQPSSMDAYSTTVFKPLNESRKILLTLSELRRIVQAAMLLKEAKLPGGGVAPGAADAARASGRAAGGVVGTAADVGKKGLELATDFVKALDGTSAKRRTAIVDAIRSASNVEPTRVARLDAILGRNDDLTKVFDSSCKRISNLVDDELIDADFWSTVGAGTNPSGGATATAIIKDLLQARAAAASGNTTAGAFQAIGSVARSTRIDTEAAARTVTTALKEGGDDALIKPENLKRITAALSAKTNKRDPTVGSLLSAVQDVKNSILNDLFKPAITVTIKQATSQRTTKTISRTITCDVQNYKITVSDVEVDVTGRTVAKPVEKNSDVEVDVAGRPVANPVETNYVIGDQSDMTELTALIQGSGIADTEKASIVAKINSAKLAVIEDKFSDGSSIQDALIEQTAANNSRGVLRAALAILTDSGYAGFIAKEGLSNEDLGTFGTTFSMIKSKPAVDRLRDIGVDVKDSVAKYFDSTSLPAMALDFVGYTGFVPMATGKTLLALTGHPFYSTTALGRWLTKLSKSKIAASVVGTWFVTWIASGYRERAASTPGERATAEYPTLLQLADVAAEIIRPGPFTNLIQAFMDNIVYGGGGGTREFSEGDVIGEDNILSAYGKILGGAPTDLLNALKAYDAMLEASPQVFPDLLETDTTTGIQEKVATATSSVAGFAVSMFSWLTLEGTSQKNVDEIIRATNTAAAAIQYSIDASKSIEAAIKGNQDWNNIEGSRQAAVEVVKSALQARAAGAGRGAVSVINYKDNLIVSLKRSDEKSPDNKIVDYGISFLTGVSDPAYYDQASAILNSNATGDSLMQMYLQAAGVTPPIGVPVGEFVTQTYGISETQFKALSTALDQLSTKTRPQSFKIAGSSPPPEPSTAPPKK